MGKVSPLFMAAAQAAQYMLKLLEMKVGLKAHQDMDCQFCQRLSLHRVIVRKKI